MMIASVWKEWAVVPITPSNQINESLSMHPPYMDFYGATTAPTSLSTNDHGLERSGRGSSRKSSTLWGSEQDPASGRTSILSFYQKRFTRFSNHSWRPETGRTSAS